MKQTQTYVHTRTQSLIINSHGLVWEEQKVTVGASVILHVAPNTWTLVSGLFLVMLLGHIAHTTLLNRVKECLFLGIYEAEVNGCQKMQRVKKSSCMTFILVRTQNGAVIKRVRNHS